MEFNFACLLATISVNILNFDNLWNKLDDVNEFVYFININHINDLLLEKLAKLWIHFLKELRVLFGEFFHVLSQQ